MQFPFSNKSLVASTFPCLQDLNSHISNTTNFSSFYCVHFFLKQTDPSLNHFLNAVRHVFFLTITFVRLSEEKLEQIAHTSMHNGWGPSGHCPAVSQKNHCPAVWKEALCLPRKHCDAGGSHPPTGDLFTTKNMTSHVVFKGYGLYNGFEFETIILIKKKDYC